MSTVALEFSGRVQGVQPRIDMVRSFDERTHSYLGYLLYVDGLAGVQDCAFGVRIGPHAQAKHAFRAGDRIVGRAHAVAEPAREIADLYRASALGATERGCADPPARPPFLGVPLPLPAYRERGHRRLDSKTYDARCRPCRYGCRMVVAIIRDSFKPDVREYRTETACYGPKSCPFYRAGPTRKVPGRRGQVYEEEDWVDEDAVAHRGPDE